MAASTVAPPNGAENIELNKRQRLLLATIAAHGILNHNVAVDMPDRFSADGIIGLLPNRGDDLETLRADLELLERSGLLYEFRDRFGRTTGPWLDRAITWNITPAGLIHLWMTPAS